MVRVDVKVNQQQYKLIEDLRKEGKFGKTDSEVLYAVFLDFVKKKGRK